MAPPARQMGAGSGAAPWGPVSCHPHSHASHHAPLPFLCQFPSIPCFSSSHHALRCSHRLMSQHPLLPSSPQTPTSHHPLLQPCSPPCPAPPSAALSPIMPRFLAHTPITPCAISNRHEPRSRRRRVRPGQSPPSFLLPRSLIGRRRPGGGGTGRSARPLAEPSGEARKERGKAALRCHWPEKAGARGRNRGGRRKWGRDHRRKWPWQR